MSTEQLANVTTDRVAVKGFIKRDLKTWFTDNYIKQTLLEKCRDYRKNLFAKTSIHFTNGKDKSERGYYIPEFEIAFGEADEYEANDRGWLDRPQYLFTENEARNLFVENFEEFKSISGLNPDKEVAGIWSSFLSNSFFIKCKDGYLDIRNGKFQVTLSLGREAKVIPCCKLSKEEFSNGIESSQFAFVEDTDDWAKQHNDIINVLNEYQKMIEIQNVKDLAAKRIEQMLETCAERIERFCKMYPELFSVDKLDEAFNEWIASTPELNKIQTRIVLNAILMADTYRVKLNPKEETCLEESSEGHWELFDAMEGTGYVILDGKYAARNPRNDYSSDGMVGIDFGTKSTVVSLRDEENRARLLRVGTTSYDTQLQEEDVENPTILEFIDVKRFMDAYKSEETEGRPFTSEKDIRVGYYAKEDLAKAESKNLSTFLTDIKQWCGDTTGSRVPIIRDKNGYSKPLPSFDKCSTENDIDPLEIYAYYLGLMINNVYNKIYLKYVMSFPTTYEKGVRDRIIQSFKRGIKRSLPDAIVKDDELMDRFDVTPKWSEPAAYAICAMKEYHFKPEAGEKVFYSVFDFGGGTTDMIFGVWRASDRTKRKEKKFSWMVEQFKDEGDPHLGGENLLELMAYEIFVWNTLNIKQERNYPFIRPADGKAYSGLERLTVDSPAARRNMMQLVMKLRPFWEGIESYTDRAEENDPEYSTTLDMDNHSDRILKGYKIKSGIKIDFLKTGYIDIELEDDKGETTRNKLYIDCAENNGCRIDLIEILENRIEKGIDTYFNALKSALEDSRASGINKIYLLLAGNASKSPVLKRLLDKKIEVFRANYQTPIEIEILPPLGTPEFYQYMNMEINENPDRPTGKTGVAYGLVDTNVGVYEETSASDQAKFKFYVGLNEDDKFKTVMDRSVEYNKWVPLEVPADADLELYYTALADAQSGHLDISETKRKNCPVKKPDEEKDFYIRAVTPDTIEYGMGEICEDGVFDPSTISKIGDVKLTF